MADVRLTNAKDVEQSKDDIKNDINLRLIKVALRHN